MICSEPGLSQTVIRMLLKMTANDHHSHVLPGSLDAARVQALPATAYYIADFLSEEEERCILEKVTHHTWVFVAT